MDIHGETLTPANERISHGLPIGLVVAVFASALPFGCKTRLGKQIRRMGGVMTFIGLTTQKRKELAARADDRLRALVENALGEFDAVSTNRVLQLSGLPRTTGNARRIAKIMRALDFVPIKSRRLKQAGFGDSGTRGWARANQGNPKQANQVDKYILLKGGLYDSLDIVHDDANSSVGGARPLANGRFIVKNEDCEEVDIVNSIDEVIPAIAAYYEANPPRWEFEPRPDFRHTDMKAYGPRYMKESPFGPFIVFQIRVRPMGSISQ